MKWVSSGRLPYQITRYCDHIRYAQNTVKPKQSFARSCCWRTEKIAPNPIARRSVTERTASAIRAARKLPMK